MRRVFTTILVLFCVSLAPEYTLAKDPLAVEAAPQRAISFRVHNDTGARFAFVKGESVIHIPPGKTVNISAREGAPLFFCKGGRKGPFWMKVLPKLAGKTFNLSELL